MLTTYVIAYKYFQKNEPVGLRLFWTYVRCSVWFACRSLRSPRDNRHCSGRGLSARHCVLVLGQYRSYFEEHWGAVSCGTYCFIFAVGRIDVFLSYFSTIATDDAVKGRLENDQMKVILAITGPLEKATYGTR